MNSGLIATAMIAGYLLALLGLGWWSNRKLTGTAADFFLASHGIGSVLLLLSIFGTTMTAFAMQGSSGEAFDSGIGVYGKMASWSGIVHSACFFLIGTKLWSLGRRYGYTTQIQFFRERFESDSLGLLLFPILVGLVMVYILMGVIGAGAIIAEVTKGAFPTLLPRTSGGIPYWLAAAVVCGVVLVYVFFGGVRSTAWANAFQTLVFVIVGLVTFGIIADKLGGLHEATRAVQELHPEKLSRVGTSKLEFLSYGCVPLSVAMFPHLFQLWLTPRSATKFRLTVVAHPVLIMLVWLPCVLIGTWATAATFNGLPVVPPDFPNPNAVLPLMVKKLAHPALGGLLAAGILAAIVGGLDVQYLCVGTMFAHDMVAHYRRHDPLNDRELIRVGRLIVTLIVLISYVGAVMVTQRKAIFDLGVWCFSGFASMFPLVVAALYWRRATKAGAFASILTPGVIWVVSFVKADYGARGELLVLGMMPVLPMVVGAAVAFIVVSLLTAPPSPQTVARFFPPRTPIGPMHEPGARPLGERQPPQPARVRG